MQIIVAFLFLVGLLAANIVHAQSVPQATPGSVSYPITTLRNVATLGASTVSPANVGRYAFATALGGNVVADATTGLPLPDGRNLPVTVRSSVPKPQAAAAIGRFLRKSIPVLGAGVALYDLAQELGYKVQVNGGGSPLIFRAPSTRDGLLFKWQGETYGWPYESGAAACSRMAPLTGAPMHMIEHPSPGQYKCHRTDSLGPLYNLVWITNPTPPAGTPATVEQFEQAINNKTSWSPSSALGRSLVDAIKSGELIQAPPQTVSGPASTPGPVKTTTDATNNTTTTQTQRYDHTYSGPNVTTTINTTTVTVDNSTGATISNTTSTEQPVIPNKTEEEEDNSFTNSDLPTIPKLYDPKFPDGLEGVWNHRKAQLLNTSLFQLIPSLMPNMGDGGCPTWSIPSIYGGNLNASIPCSVWYFIRLVIIISALLLARRLIFGG